MLGERQRDPRLAEAVGPSPGEGGSGTLAWRRRQWHRNKVKTMDVYPEE